MDESQDRADGEGVAALAALEFSVIAPVYNECDGLEELARRCCDAAQSCGGTHEVLLVDDHSTDGTAELARQLQGREELQALRFMHLDRNRGQFGATRAGLAAARGAIVLVLDGDLQDPPEHLGALLSALRDDTRATVAFAQKARRQDPLWFLLGRAGFHALQSLSKHRVPSGVGSFCAMRLPLAQRVSAVDLPDANLASVLMALDPRVTLRPYDRAGRPHGASRVGAIGLIREALGSLAVTGALPRALSLGAMLVATLAFVLEATPRPYLLALASLLVALAAVSGSRARRAIVASGSNALSSPAADD